MAGNFFRGTSVEQDGRWGKSDEKLMAKMSKSGMFAPILDTKVNPKKINLDVINKWITQKIIEVVGFEDDILINLIINMLQGAVIDGKKMQLDVTGFLEKQAGSFVEELWNLLVDAQNQPSGIPSVFLQRKKEEILSRQQQQGSRWGSVTHASEEPKHPRDERKREHSPVDDRENDKQQRRRDRDTSSGGDRTRDRSRDNRDHDRDYTRYNSRSDRRDRDRDRNDRSRRDYDRDSSRDYRGRGDRQRSPDAGRRHNRGEDRYHSERRHNRDSRDRSNTNRREGSSRDATNDTTNDSNTRSSNRYSRSRSPAELTNKETGDTTTREG